MQTRLSKTATTRTTGMALAILTAFVLAGCRLDDAIMDDNYSAATPEERFPIKVADAPVKMNLSAKSGSLRPDQVNSVINFGQDATVNASSRIAVRYSSGSANARKVAEEAVAILVAQGVPQSMIGTGSYHGSGAVVSLSFTRRVAVTKECGDWSDNLAGDRYNESYINHGCATQQNIAAMVANPEDFERPRALAPASAASRSAAVDKYNKGESF